MDADPQPAADVTIYSIGHSNIPLADFISLLQRHSVATLADVRSAPYSRYVPHFNRPELEYALGRVGVRYLYVGEELGGRPVGDEFYDDEGYALYYRVARAPFFTRGLARLTEEAARQRTAIMCGEEDPTNCHRRLLVARVLAERGTPTLHIRGDGRIQTADDFRQGQQLSLWDDPADTASEERAWKSIRPVSRKRPPNTSSSLFEGLESDDY